MVKVFQPNLERLTKLGFASVAHVPVIFDSRQRYCREYNRYLCERALLEWHPSGDDAADYPSPGTLRKIAHLLNNWIEWSIASSIAFTAVTYGDVLKYQTDQESGRWSATGKKLNPRTANARADEVTNFPQMGRRESPSAAVQGQTLPCPPRADGRKSAKPGPRPSSSTGSHKTS